MLDIINHDILLDRLQNNIGIQEQALDQGLKTEFLVGYSPAVFSVRYLSPSGLFANYMVYVLDQSLD